MNISIDKRKISVVMSIYNEPVPWLRESIESILNQTFTNFEFIIINDNPNREENRKLLNEYQDADNRIVVIHNDENIGLTISLNKGLKIAKGEYIARMDGDDISLKDRLNIQYSFLESNPEYVVCGTLAVKINRNNKKTGMYKIPQKHDDIYNYLSYHNPLVHPSLMIRRSALTENGLLYNEKLPYSQDYELICNLINFGKAFNISQPLINYRISGTQISKSKVNEQVACADFARKKFIVKNLTNYSIDIALTDFDSTQKLKPILTKIELLYKNDPNPFLKFVALSLITNFNCTSVGIALKSLFQKKYTLKEKLKIGKVTVENLLNRIQINVQVI